MTTIAPSRSSSARRTRKAPKTTADDAILASVGDRQFRLHPRTGIADLVEGPRLPTGHTSEGRRQLTLITNRLPLRGDAGTFERARGWTLVDARWEGGGRVPDPRAEPEQLCHVNAPSEVVFTMGLPGAGKSSALKRLGISETHQVIDPDVVKESLPGYDPKNPGLVHDESKRITDRMWREALAAGRGRFAVDGTGTSVQTMIRKIRQALTHGFVVRVLYVRVRLETALHRNSKRQRVVPEAIIREKAEDMETAVDLIAREPVCFQILDND